MKDRRFMWNYNQNDGNLVCAQCGAIVHQDYPREHEKFHESLEKLEASNKVTEFPSNSQNRGTRV